MDITITGTVLSAANVPSPFAMQFSLDGGTAVGAGCGSALMNAQVGGFSVEVGNDSVSIPSAFSANITSTCYSGNTYGELVGAYPLLTLESQGDLLVNHARIFDGNIGAWHIETAQLSIASAPEPSVLGLLIAAYIVAYSWRRITYLLGSFKPWARYRNASAA